MSQAIVNKNNDINSLQISKLINISTNNGYKLNSGFLLKNITDDTITLEVKLINSDNYIKTTFYEGWNPEILKEIKTTPYQIQIGY